MMFDGITQDLGVLPLVNPFAVLGTPEFSISTARGITTLTNGTILVVGFSGVFSFAGTGIDRAFVWTGGALQEIGTLVPIPFVPGSFIGNSQAYGVNNGGLVVGVSDTAMIGPNASPLRRAFVYDASSRQFTALDTLWRDPVIPNTFLGNSEARAVNESGVVVGVSDTGQVAANGEPIRHAFRYDPSAPAGQQMQGLGTLWRDPNNPNAFLGNSEARAVNKDGQIVGVSDTVDANGQTVQRAFLYASGSMRSLNTLWPDPINLNAYLGNSEANGINDNGVAVGVSDTGQVDANGEHIRHGFMWDPTIRHPENLNAPPLPGGWTIIEATGVTNSMDICGHGVDAAAVQRGLLLFM